MNNNDNKYLKELKLWLCASLRNSNATLICESIKETKENENELNEIVNMLNEVIEKLQQILIILQGNNEMNRCHCIKIEKENEENEDEQREGN